MEGLNSYIVLSMNGDESVFIPDLVPGYLPNLFVTETCSPKILTDVEFLASHNAGGSVNTNNENLVLEPPPPHSNNEVVSDNTMIKCPLCEDTFDDINLYIIHQNVNHYACSKCNKSFKEVNLFKKHLLTHVDDKLYNCVLCSSGFNFENNYKVHMALHGNSLVCPICELSFQRKASLKSHLAIHQVEEFYTCPECASEFENMVVLRKHIKTHIIQVNKNKPTGLICNYCKVKFDTPILLKQHVACHLKVKRLVLNGKKARKKQVEGKELKHKCKVCEKTFPKLSLLERHLRIHNGDRPFECPICSKGFSQKGTLQIHLSKHSGVKPFWCTLCPAKFYQKCNLKVHVQKTHTAISEGEKNFQCSKCHCIFKKVASLNGHMRKFHADTSPITITTVIDQLKDLEKQLGGNIAESERSRTTENPSNLSNLDTSHQHDIPKANKNENLRVYSLIQKEDGPNKVYICSYCNKESKKPSDLIRHIRTHTKEKPFKCHCGRSFAIKSTLQAHMQIHKAKKCLKCSMVTFSAKVWRAHLRKHRTDSIHKNNTELQECQDVAVREPLSSKTKNFISDKPVKCQLCPSSFLRKTSLKRHMRLHTGDRTSKCEICSRLFVSAYSLKKHIKCHTAPKNFSCDLCNKKFTKQSLLKRHFSTHDNTKPYECPYCGKRFKKLTMCRKHIDKHGEFNGVQNKTQDECNITIGENNLPLNNFSDHLSQKSILRVDANGVVFDHSFDLQQNNNAKTNPVLESVQTINQPTAIVDSSSVLDSQQNQNLQTILVSCPELENSEVLNNYILSELKLQTNDAIILNAVNDDNKQSSIVLKVQNLNVDPLPNVENVIDEDAYSHELGEKSVDPVFNFTETRSLLKKSRIISPTLEPTKSCIQNDIGDNFLSNNISLYPNTQINFNATPELNSDTVNVIESTGDAFMEVLDNANRNLQSLDVATETQETMNLSMIHCLACKKMFDTMESYHKHVCMKSILKKNNVSIPCEELQEEVNQKCDGESTDVDKVNEKSKKLLKRFFSCVYCGKEFSNSGVYRKHVNSHQENGLHICKFCEKVFRKPSDLGRHLRIHTGEKPFACDKCDKKFRLKCTLEFHYKTHNPSAAKKFVCEVCNSFFSSMSSKKLHMHLHTGAKPHKCNYCDQHFRTIAHRKCHEKKMHLSTREKKVNQSKAKRITNILAAAVDMAVNEVSSDNQALEQHDIPGYSEIQVEFADPSDSIQIDQTLLHLQSSNIFLEEIDHNVLACSESVDDLVDLEARDIIDSECFEENVAKNHVGGNSLCDICQEECDTPDGLRKHIMQFHEQSHLDRESYSCFLCDISLVGVQQLKTHLRSVHQIVETSSQLIF